MSHDMLNAIGKISFVNLADYQHNMLQGLVDSVNYYSLGDSRRCLPIRYLKQQHSDSTDEETGMSHKQFNNIYFEYHLTPVLENEMLNPMINIDETKQGMNANSTGELVILSIEKPLVNDLFDFYIQSHNGMDNQKEIFRVMEVNFLRTSGGLNVYRLTYETAPIRNDYIKITQSFFWFNDFRRFFPSKYIEFMKKIVKKEYLINILKYYRKEWSIIYDYNLTKEVNLKLNKVILYLKYKDYTNSGEFPLILINGFDPSKVVDPLMEDDDSDTLNFRKEDVWYDDPNYDPSINASDPNYVWKWTDGKIKNELAYAVWEALHYYKPFISNLDELDDEVLNENLFNTTDVNLSTLAINKSNNDTMLSMAKWRNYNGAVIEFKEVTK